MQKERRLRKNRDFQNVFRRGTSVANRQLVLYVHRNPNIAHFRVGISVSKKIGHAVIRNRLKRRLKEIIREKQEHISEGIDLVMIVRAPAVDLSYDDLKKSVIHVLKRARIYQR